MGTEISENTEREKKIQELLTAADELLGVENEKAAEFSMEALKLIRDYEKKGLEVKPREGRAQVAKTQEAKALMFLGIVEIEKGDFAEGLRYFLPALEAVRETTVEDLKIEICYETAQAYSSVCQYTRSLEVLMEALPLAREHKHPYLPRITNLIGILHANIGNQKEYAEYLKRAMEEAIEMNSSFLAAIYNNLSDLYMKEGDLEKALESCLKGIQAAKENGSRDSVAACTLTEGEIYTKMGDYDQALASYQEALGAYEALGYDCMQSFSWLSTGELFMETGQLSEADRTLEKALHFAVKRGRIDILSEVHATLAKNHEQQGRYQKALEHFREHVKFRDQLKLEEMTKQMKYLEVENQIHEIQMENEIYKLRNIELANTLKELKETQEQLLQSEKMASLGRIVAGLAHEMNTPLGALNSSIGNLQLLVDRLKKPEEENRLDHLAKSSFQTVRQSLGRIGEVVGTLKRFSRVDESEMVQESLAQCLADVAYIASCQEERRPTIKTELEPLPREWLDVRQLNFALLNLVHALYQDEHSTLLLRSWKTEERYFIEIRNPSWRIEEEYQRHFFEPTFEKQRERVGVDLSISTVPGILRSNGLDFQLGVDENGTWIEISGIRKDR